jgi:GT2 family glycosyltransferase
MKSKFAILIVNWNSHADVGQILNVVPKNIPVVIVDNNSVELQKLEETIEKSSNAVLVRSRVNGGYGAGMNLAIRYVQSESLAEHVLLLNPDVYLTEDFLRHVDRSCGSFDILGFQQYSTNDKGEKNYYPCAANFHKGKIKLLDMRSNGSQAVDIVTGAAMLIRVEAFEGVGLFDEDFFHYKEEFDLCFRMKNSGRTVAIDYEIPLHHKAGSSLAHGSASAIYYQVRNEILFAKKHRDISSFKSFLNIGAVIRKCASLGTPSKYRTIRAATLDGLLCKTGIRRP